MGAGQGSERLILNKHKRGTEATNHNERDNNQTASPCHCQLPLLLHLSYEHTDLRRHKTSNKTQKNSETGKQRISTMDNISRWKKC